MYKMNGEFLISGKFQIVVYSLCNFFVCSLFTLFYTKNDFRSKFKAKKWIKVEKYENHEIHRKYTGNIKKQRKTNELNVVFQNFHFNSIKYLTIPHFKRKLLIFSCQISNKFNYHL